MTVHRPLLQNVALALLLLLLVAGCGDGGDSDTGRSGTPQAGTGVAQQLALPSSTPTVTPTPLPSNTPGPSATPTPTLIPTPTIPPFDLDGDPRALTASDPSPQPGAPCGVVDLLDFPIDPPDAEDISRGGQDFGRFRRRYDGYHAGEDWWGTSRGSTFGTPVYSIGHGQITYANGFGWGADQGVIIVRHTFADGRSFLSFYGHLDPPSVEVRFGNCVTRGQQIGQIGRPRGSPHLHFEIRTHTPDDPGPGYWPSDPTLAGWLPPSQTIWNQRIGVSPGVLWQRPSAEENSLGVGLWQENTAVVVEETALVGVNVADGSERWRLPTVEEEPTPAGEDDDDDDEISTLGDAVFDAAGPILYTADRLGLIAAFRLPQEATEEAAGTAAPELLWDLQLHDVRGTPMLIPLPNGGVAHIVQDRLLALSPEGAILWRQTFAGEPVAWLALADRTLVSVAGQEASLWQLQQSGPLPWGVTSAGHLVQTDQNVLLYNGDGLYRLDPETRSAGLFYALPDGLSSQGDVVALPDGGVLVAHMDAGGQRLLALDSTGALRWQRSYDGLVEGRPHLLVMNGEAYLIADESNSDWSQISLYAITPNNAALTQLFNGGSRSPSFAGTWTLTSPAGRLLVNIGGGSLVALQPELALQAICGVEDAAAC